MNTYQDTKWHHGLVSLLALLFYGILVLDYLALKLKIGFYTARLTEDQMAYMSSVPNWLNVIWAISVWGGLLGAWLLFRKNWYAVLTLFFAFSLMTLLMLWLSFVQTPTFIGVFGMQTTSFVFGGCVVAFFIYLYARTQRSEHRI